MLDMKLVRSNPELVKENIKKKFQDEKLPLVDEVLALDEKFRASKARGDELRQQRNQISKEIGKLMGQGKKDEAQEVKKRVQAIAGELEEMERQEEEMTREIRKRMLVIPNIIDPSVPIGKDDSENVEVERFGEPTVPDFQVPYHTEIMERFAGIDLDSARKTSGNGFYYLLGDIARLHSAVLSYARDFMIGKGFTYCIPPYMIHANVVEGVMSQTDMDAMMYKIEGEDLYLIGTSEHSMIGKFIDTILTEDQLPQTLTSYSPCFRKEKGAHGIEERGVYRIHQFEKQEMIVVCKPEDAMDWYEKMWRYSVELFRSMDIPVRQLECCSGDLADLKVKSCDIEAWSPRQKKYFEVCSCSNLGDAQARRLGIRIKGKEGNTFAHTLNNTVVAPPRMLIAFLENNLQADGSVKIPAPLRPYMGGTEVLLPKK
ncbi:MAG TPA: serine--tRNA ligase [Candidatus Acutalibacter pullistercoris]|uniref:Serine--tRNA ligase n=1 Tax=Candidatus Acutalibacter pullistercoris TaxID=2838418 RepID=A0A9D1YGR5_9FIRM|nr:serine--tRNA ligase [Candidatus Acutalibacter pullistercoris]